MKQPLYNQEGREVGHVELSDEIFARAYNADLVHQVLVSIMANRRKSIADTKGRGEVRGGGKKPWNQKGTGRARHGSTRSPIWKGGGVTFGPKSERNFSQKINKKAKRNALFSALSRKVKENEIRVVDTIALKQPKTREMAQILGAITKKPAQKKKYDSLVVTQHAERGVILATRNLPKAFAMEAKNLNLHDVLNYKFLIMTKEAIEEFQKMNA